MGAEKTGQFRVLNFTDLLVEALGGTPHIDILKQHRLQDDLKWVVAKGQTYLRQHGITVDPQQLEAMLPELFASAEFKGGLTCLV